MNTKKLSLLTEIGRNAILALWAIFALFPLFWMVLITFKHDAEMYTTTFIFTPTLENYKAVLVNTNYFKAFFDNIIVSGGAVLVSVLVGVPAAYALARYNFKKKEDLAFQILSFKFAPEILVILPLFCYITKLDSCHNNLHAPNVPNELPHCAPGVILNLMHLSVHTFQT